MNGAEVKLMLDRIIDFVDESFDPRVDGLQREDFEKGARKEYMCAVCDVLYEFIAGLQNEVAVNEAQLVKEAERADLQLSMLVDIENRADAVQRGVSDLIDHIEAFRRA